MATHKKETHSTGDTNPDPITGAPGSHPVETGVGAAIGGAAAGAAAGAVAGPAGVIAGAAIGAVAGGYAGKAVGESFDPTAEDAYWREAYTRRPYYNRDYSFDDYGPDYAYGYESYARYPNKRFEDVEPGRLDRAPASFDGETVESRLARRKRNWIGDVSFG